jgi:hypothetical protein
MMAGLRIAGRGASYTLFFEAKNEGIRRKNAIFYRQ